MSAVTVRNLTPAVHRALKLRAARNGRSTEAEIRAILEDAVQPRVGLGAQLAAIGERLGGVELETPRDRTGVVPADFE